MKQPSAWPKQAYLDALRPDPGTEVRAAILASYSADITSIVAVLLALAGSDDKKGSGSKAAFAEAIELLRGKVRILIQCGRLARPRRLPLIAGILDQFVRQIDFDEREQSWHPKVSLVALADGYGGTDWRLWLGSRNLTIASNRDFGLLLKSASGHAAADASPIPGFGEMAVRLAEHAELESFRPSARVLNAVRWMQPEGLRVERITLTGGQGTDRPPSPPDDLDEVIVVSPFLDGSVVKKIGAWGGAETQRFLLSTELALAKIAGQAGKPLSSFGERLFTLDAPAPDAVEPADVAPEQDENEEDEEEEGEQILFGLHAKIYCVRKGQHLRLWVGSPNATERAWDGRNVEVIAELSARAGVEDGVKLLLSRPISAAALEAGGPPPDDAAKERLEGARTAFVATWKGKLEREGSVFRLASPEPPHPGDASIKVEAGLATGALLEWRRSDACLLLGEYAPNLHTELVHFRLSAGAMSCAWLQRVEASPPLDAQRDRHAIYRYLGPRGFAALIAALLSGDWSGVGGDAWDAPSVPVTQRGSAALFEGSDLTLDAMLACWARDPAGFKRAAERVDAYLGPILELPGAFPPEDLEPLRRFQTVWKTVSEELLKDR